MRIVIKTYVHICLPRMKPVSQQAYWICLQRNWFCFLFIYSQLFDCFTVSCLLNCLVINFILNMIRFLHLFLVCCSFCRFVTARESIVIYYHRKTNVIYLLVTLIVHIAPKSQCQCFILFWFLLHFLSLSLYSFWATSIF